MLNTATLVATQRFGLGPRPGDLARIDDPRGWLQQQLQDRYVPPPPLAPLADSPTILAAFLEARREQREARKDGDAARAAGHVFRDKILPHYLAQVEARTRIAVEGDQPFRERLVWFWGNHFAVSVDKPVVAGIAGSFENEAIRPHVAGNFADMLVAVEQHPAMILYLDNQLSVGPDSRVAEAARRHGQRRKVDINENLGREILELHTLGVNGGYTQADVISLARVLTGWSIGGGNGPFAAGRPGAFIYRANAHEPGTHTVLGRAYRESGVDQGEAVLRDLALHPATARHLATKLVRHFIADDPPPDSVARVASAYLAGAGDLPTTYRALLAEHAAWNPAPVKFKTPTEFVVSALRALAVEPPAGRILAAYFQTLGQRTYSPGSPAGWPDTARDWDGADALMKRVEWSLAYAARTASLADARAVATSVLGIGAEASTLRSVSRAESNAQALALLFMSPEFLRR